jgi:predicted nucleic acid-binding protein
VARLVVADAGPLIAFAAADLLAVLRALFGVLTTPESVRAECIAKPGADAERIVSAITDGWLRVEAVRDHSETLPTSLGRGEADAIRLALHRPEETLLILDDRIARRHALKRGLSIVGTVRLLDLAERRGLIDDAPACIERMAAHGYRIAPDLLARIRSE